MNTALITGASSGFGAAIAKRFAADGTKVVIAGRRTERLEALRQEIGPPLAHVLTLDVRDRATVQQAFDTLPAPFSEIDVLVNNAGLALGMSNAQESALNDWDAMVDTNIKGLMYCTRAILPQMVKRQRGHVINIGSAAGEFPYPGGNVYGGTKAFVYQFTLNLRADLAGTGVRVTDIAPGLAGGTEFSEVRFHGDRDKASAVYAGVTPLSADNVADAVHWAATRPAHVNVNAITLMPVAQSFAPFAISRK